ncbi:MAG: glycosyltransferase, partial [Verrucomicrobiota bacterium]
PDHPHIHVLNDGVAPPLRRTKLHIAGWRAVWRSSYDAVHAVDESVFFAMRLCRWRKIALVYDAFRCFSGKAGSGISGLMRFFPKHLQRLEAKVLEWADIVFSPCSVLTGDLHGMNRDAPVLQLEDVPVQPFFAQYNAVKSPFSETIDKPRGPVVLCSLLPGHALEISKLLLAVRKVVDVVPDMLFYLKGVPHGQAKKMAANLDISDQCVFLPPNEPEAFLSALEIAEVTLMVPPGNGRYIHPQVYTLLYASAPLMTISNAAYDEVLTEKTSVRVLPNAESIAEGLLRTIREPLFSLAIAMEGQQLVAERHTCSSFKHKIRMAYHDLDKTAP